VTGHALSVRRLRFRDRIANPLAARGRVERALAGGASASQLGKEAILCVRRIAVPLARVDKLSGALDAEIPKAARPAREAVPANANAVLFADRAELLACLARDWCAGHASASWWWPVLFPGNDFAALVRRLWLEDARPVPAALERLESVGLAAGFLARLPPLDTAALWRNIVNTFQLPALDAAWSALEITATNPVATTEPRAVAPWTPWITPDSSLPKDVARVLIVAILLERAPAQVRSASFAHEVRSWNRTERIESVAQLAPGSVSSSRGVQARSDSRETSDARESSSRKTFPLPAGTSREADVPRGAPPPVVLEPCVTEAPPNAERLWSANPPIVECAINHAPGASSALQECPTSFPMREERATIPLERGGPIASSVSTTEECVELPSPALAHSITTEWGGLLYLVNVAIALELYGDFTTPARPGLPLPLWDFLVLIGGRMIGEEFEEDPLSGLFAKLSGRAGDEPAGADFEPPTGEPLAIWLDRICHEIQARVAASLDLREQFELRALVLNRHAKIETSSARLDAYFLLANHPIALRVAGLDRDPGWVPAAGRSIYFHYD
jgi:hypothetical protein